MVNERVYVLFKVLSGFREPPQRAAACRFLLPLRRRELSRKRCSGGVEQKGSEKRETRARELIAKEWRVDIGH